MTFPQSTSPQAQHKHACSLCARRKVKCNKADPCSNCDKAKARCLYEVPVQPRPRKRAADEDLLSRLAAYEELMRKNNIDYSQYAHTWVTSGPNGQVKEHESISPVSTLPTISHDRPWTRAQEEIPTETERCLWASLPPELKYPPYQSLPRNDDGTKHPGLSMSDLLSSSQPGISQVHPEPRQIYRFWQVFVESVNPLLKIIHVPTLQQRVLDASWNPSSAPKPLAAMLFVIYALAVASTSGDECLLAFGETKVALSNRYRHATFRALVEADFLTTRDFEVLQALVLFLFSGPDSELTSTLTGAAIRIGQKIGLHLYKADPNISAFDGEMRVRLWWQLYGIDARTRAAGRSSQPSAGEFGNVCLPLNVNDADLHPEMTELPTEHTGPTEMSYVLVKFEVTNWVRSSARASVILDLCSQGTARGTKQTGLEDKAIDELEARYHEKFLRHLDHNVPLYALTYAMAKIAIARMRCKVHNPRGQAWGVGEALMSREKGDVLFESILTWLEMLDLALRTKFSSHLITHMTTRYTLDAYIYMISDLRRRCSGERVALAWRLVEKLYEEHPEMIRDISQNTFFAALGDLTLEAWEARRKELVDSQETRAAGLSPAFIHSIWDQRRNQAVQVSQLSAPELQNLDAVGLMENGDLDWEYWNDFLRL
ncbi:C6 zinc finger domain-containing protein [Colletotrichum navitas]|uniref:C6 zinc finger domain-containing protein n=1 Tax=Colletotrichum navitas TaxID=681940 RepID=A0AAD8PL35_9PEZI|nr:C6 zinc finger domain-containing protein [Colletotrichum navitas]KAK1566185.1 C6 zinc finger domain-containing protein [Colletotrichum navitas]